MKMSIVDRVLLTIYTLIIILASLAILAVSAGIGLGLIHLEGIKNYISVAELSWEAIVITSIIAILFLVVSIKLLFSGVKKSLPQSTLLKNTELGMIRVSLATLDTFAQKAVKSFEEVRDVKTIIIPDMEDIRVQMKIMVMPDVKLPELTVSIQEKVKDYIESLSGIRVKEVRIYVDNLATVQKSRVE